MEVNFKSKGVSMDDQSIVNSINGNQENVKNLEEQISKMFQSALAQKPIPTEFLDRIAYYKANLHHPITLYLSGTDITDEALEHLKGLPIEELRLLRCKNLTNSCLRIIAQIPSIEVLKLGGNSWVNDDTLSEIPSSVKTLSIADCRNFTQLGLVRLLESHVSSLDLSGCTHLKDDDWEELPDHFERLECEMCTGMGEKAMKRLSELTKLKYLDLTNIPLTDDLIFLLPKHLLSLSVSGNLLSVKAFEAIGGMTDLQDLSITTLGINGEGLSILPESLVSLNLAANTVLTDEWVRPLAKRKQLRYLNLLRCSEVTKEAVDSFSNTQIKVEFVEPRPTNMAMRALRNHLNKPTG